MTEMDSRGGSQNSDAAPERVYCERLEKGDCDDTDNCRAYGCRWRDTASRLDAYLEAVGERLVNIPHEREGQAYFNVLYFQEFDPEFADSIRGGNLDPFYRDERIASMLDALKARWAA